MPRLLRLLPPFFLSSLFLLIIGVSLKGSAICRDSAPSSVPAFASTSIGVVSRADAESPALGAVRLAALAGSSVASSTTSTDPRGLRPGFLDLGTTRPSCVVVAAAAAELDFRLVGFLDAAGASEGGGGEDARLRPLLCLGLAGAAFFNGATSGSSDVLIRLEPRVKWKSPSCSSYTAAAEGHMG